MNVELNIKRGVSHIAKEISRSTGRQVDRH
jgi:hypothetical protein